METDYKKIYSNNLNGLSWNKNLYDVHHIDFNHDNNDFNNLVLLPKKLHLQFHSSYNQLKSVKDFLDLDVLSPIPQQINKICLFDSYFSNFWNLKINVSTFWTIKKDIENGCLPIGLEWKNLDFDSLVKFYSPSLYKKYCKK